MWPVSKMFRALFGAPIVRAPKPANQTRYRYVINGRTYEADTLAECLQRYNADVGLLGPWGAVGEGVSDEARARAKETLVSFLNEEQRKTFEEEHFFEVIGSQGNRYRIMTNGSASGNVTWRAPGSEMLQNLLPNAHFTVGGTYCAYPRKTDWNGKAIPVLDQILGQMLELVADENAYLAKANLFGGTYPSTYTGRESWRPPAPLEGFGAQNDWAQEIARGMQAALHIQGGPAAVQVQQVAWGVERYEFRNDT